MADNEIIKALECCTNDDEPNCKECTKRPHIYCICELLEDAYGLIKRQQERMDGIVEKLEEMMQRHIAEAKRQEEYGNYYNIDHEIYAAGTYKYFIKQLKERSTE